jgi:hypothetical protein
LVDFRFSRWHAVRRSVGGTNAATHDSPVVFWLPCGHGRTTEAAISTHPNNTPVDEWSDGWLRMECVSIIETRTGKDIVGAFAEASRLTTQPMRDMVREHSSRHADATRD